ncbi:MAG TPA: hypothetical protein VK281_08815 [Xanthobacteraceae bacterium]|nr:hypothetical protein [Xanthobacteraceae bacterium]
MSRDLENDEEFGPRKAWQLGGWATVAVAAFTMALVAGFFDSGARRARTEESPHHAAAPGSPGFDAEMEARRLADAVRLLAADRDRLAARITTLERNLSDVTGSVSGAQVASRSAERPSPSAANVPPMLAPAPAAPPAPTQAVTPAGGPQITAPSPRSVQMQAVPNAIVASQSLEPAAGDKVASFPVIVDSGPGGSVVTKTDFGVDLGSAASVDGLRALWLSVRAGNEVLLDGLHPVVSIREGKPGAFELRLVAGPLSNAGAAARLCATLSAAALTCQPAVFDGQRLALK